MIQISYYIRSHNIDTIDDPLEQKKEIERNELRKSLIN